MSDDGYEEEDVAMIPHSDGHVFTRPPASALAVLTGAMEAVEQRQEDVNEDNPQLAEDEPDDDEGMPTLHQWESHMRDRETPITHGILYACGDELMTRWIDQTGNSQ